MPMNIRKGAAINLNIAIHLHRAKMRSMFLGKLQYFTNLHCWAIIVSFFCVYIITMIPGSGKFVVIAHLPRSSFHHIISYPSVSPYLPMVQPLFTQKFYGLPSVPVLSSFTDYWPMPSGPQRIAVHCGLIAAKAGGELCGAEIFTVPGRSPNVPAPRIE